MTWKSEKVVEIVLILIVLWSLSPILGGAMARLYRGVGPRFIHSIETFIFKLLRVNPTREMSWKTYLAAFVIFHLMGGVFLLFVLRAQAWLPFNPLKQSAVSWDLAVNITVSYITHTNWQPYSGELVLSPLSQMLGLTVQNFLTAASSLCVMTVLARGLRRKFYNTLGNFWVDVTRGAVFILLPFSLLLSIVLLSEGSVQSFQSPIEVSTLEENFQTIHRGPIASQTAIKIIGANGGGYFGASSAQPFENPTPVSNFICLVAILLLPASCFFCFGRLVGDRRHGWALFGTALLLLIGSVSFGLWAQSHPNTALEGLPFLEGVETRFGIFSSSLWSFFSTATANGAVNATISSLSPLAGLICLVNMLLGEVIFGALGVGVSALVLYSIVTVFVAGLMVGRTPEYLGKKISSNEVILASVGTLGPGLLILALTALTCSLPLVHNLVSQPGPHGLSEVFYTFTSAVANNGSSMGSLKVAHPYFLWTTSLAMLLGRFIVFVPLIALAGKFASQKITPPSLGTFPTHGALFVCLLSGIVLVVGALIFLLALALGPIMEHLLMLQGRTF